MSLVPLLMQEESITTTMPKLSSIFRRASMELQQIRCSFGQRSQKMACAWGAIRFYLGDEENLGSHVQTPNSPEFVELRRQVDLLDNHLIKTYKTSIIGMNDDARWSFTQFAEECEKLGI